MADHTAADLSKSLQTSSLESPFQVGESQLKAIRKLETNIYAETKIPNKDALPTPPSPLMKKSSKLPRVEDQTAPPPREDLDEEYQDIEQKLTSPTKTTSPSAATREKWTKTLKELVKQRRRGHYTGKNMTYRKQHTHKIPERREQEWSQQGSKLQY